MLYWVIQASTPMCTNIRRKFTLNVRTFAISRIHITICRRLNYSLIKQMLNFMFAQRYALIYSMLALILVVETTRALHSECVSSHSFITFYQLLCSALLFIVGSDGLLCYPQARILLYVIHVILIQPFSVDVRLGFVNTLNRRERDKVI